MKEKKQMKIDITGMKCEGCMNRVKNVLSTLDNVEMCQVDLQGATITFNDTLEEQVVKEKVEALGFTVTNIKQDN